MPYENLVLSKAFDSENAKAIDDHLDEYKKRSTGTYRQKKTHIYRCLNYINKPLQEINKRDLLDFLRSVDSTPIKLQTKNLIYCNVNVFFEYLEDFFDLDGIDFKTPMPSKRIFSFTKTEGDFDEKINIVFSDEELISILETAMKKSLRDFIIYGILTLTGMRISECLTIKVENINFEKLMIKTGMVKDAKKSNKLLKFFITKKFSNYLKLYISIIGKNYWLFPSKIDKLKHMKYPGFYEYCDLNHFGKRALKFHNFRHTIITRRINMGCDLHISEMLTNHKASSVQLKNYWDITDEEKRVLYLKWFPFNAISYFK